MTRQAASTPVPGDLLPSDDSSCSLCKALMSPLPRQIPLIHQATLMISRSPHRVHLPKASQFLKTSNRKLGSLGAFGSNRLMPETVITTVRTQKSDMFGKILLSCSTPTVNHPIPPLNGISIDSL